AINFLGRTTPRQAAAILMRCRLFVGNDSGLMHVAAAVKIPVVEISGFRIGGDPTHHNSPARFRPWGVPQHIVQPGPGAGELAIGEVSLAAVQSAVDTLLEEIRDSAAADTSMSRVEHRAR